MPPTDCLGTQDVGWDLLTLALWRTPERSENQTGSSVEKTRVEKHPFSLSPSVLWYMLLKQEDLMLKSNRACDKLQFASGPFLVGDHLMSTWHKGILEASDDGWVSVPLLILKEHEVEHDSSFCPLCFETYCVLLQPVSRPALHSGICGSTFDKCVLFVCFKIRNPGFHILLCSFPVGLGLPVLDRPKKRKFH